MFDLLKKFWFSFLFIFLAAISIGVLFGYRFSLTDTKIEQRGVLFLEGNEKKITLIMDNQTHDITLPYLDSSVTQGVHTIRLEKKGYQPYTEKITINLEKAVHLKIDFAPLTTTLTKQSYKDTEKVVHYFLNNKYFVEYYKDTHVISFFQDTTSIKLHKPDRVQTIKFLEPGEEILEFSSFKDDEYLLKSSLHWRVCSIGTLLSCTLIEGTSKDTLLHEQGILMRIPEGNNTMYIIDEYTGQSGKVLIENAPVESISINQEDSDSEITHILGHTTSSGSILKKNIFGYTSLSTISPLPLSLQQFQGDYFLRTATGALFNASKKELVAQDITGIYSNNENLYFTTKTNTIESFSENTQDRKELLRFEKQPEKIIFVPGKLYAYVIFPESISYCEAESFHYCYDLTPIDKHSHIEYLPQLQYFLSSSEGTWNFVFLPDTKDSL